MPFHPEKQQNTIFMLKAYPWLTDLVIQSRRQKKTKLKTKSCSSLCIYCEYSKHISESSSERLLETNHLIPNCTMACPPKSRILKFLYGPVLSHKNKSPLLPPLPIPYSNWVHKEILRIQYKLTRLRNIALASMLLQLLSY